MPCSLFLLSVTPTVCKRQGKRHVPRSSHHISNTSNHGSVCRHQDRAGGSHAAAGCAGRARAAPSPLSRCGSVFLPCAVSVQQLRAAAGRIRQRGSEQVGVARQDQPRRCCGAHECGGRQRCLIGPGWGAAHRAQWQAVCRTCNWGGNVAARATWSPRTHASVCCLTPAVTDTPACAAAAAAGALPCVAPACSDWQCGRRLPRPSMTTTWSSSAAAWAATAQRCTRLSRCGSV
jgi:hypothetical protein